MDIVIVVISLFLSAFFSGMEIAFISADKLRIEIERKKETIQSKIINIFINKPNKFIATMLLGNNVALVVYGLMMAKILEPLIALIIDSEFWILITQTLAATILILFAGEFIPKTVFRINPNKALTFFSIPVFLIYLAFYPLTMFTIFLSNFFLKYLLKANVVNSRLKTVFGKIDLTNFLDKSDVENDEIDDEVKIIQNTLDFAKIKLRECIVPRNEIVALEQNATITELKTVISETGYSKIPIYVSSIDNIIGYVHTHGLFNDPKLLKEIIVDIPIVPETMTAQKLFNILLRKKRSIALVVDEYGGTSGIVTIEDILEEIFGEIEDEHDVSDLIAKKIDDTTFEFSGRVEIDQINDEFNIGIPVSEDYETLSGYILTQLERFPEQEELINFAHFDIKIIKIDPPKIELVRLILNEELKNN